MKLDVTRKISVSLDNELYITFEINDDENVLFVKFREPFEYPDRIAIHAFCPSDERIQLNYPKKEIRFDNSHKAVYNDGVVSFYNKDNGEPFKQINSTESEFEELLDLISDNFEWTGKVSIIYGRWH